MVADFGNKGAVQNIPGVSLLGHAELFLKFDALQHLAEVQDGKRGRFGSTKSVMCSSNDATYAFAETYWRELSTVFTDNLVHIGCDEVWDLGFCDTCRARLNDDMTYASLLNEHVTRMRDFLTGDLNKTVMIWEDMSSDYPELVETLPKDVIRVVWKYEPIVDCTPSYFGRVKNENRFAEYDTLGIPYWYAPRELDLRNITSFTEFAEGMHSPSGVLMTIWERSHSLLHIDHPKIVFAGKLWDTPCDSRDIDALWADTCNDLFGTRDEHLCSTLWAIGNQEPWHAGIQSPQSLIHGTQTAYMAERDAMNQQLTLSLNMVTERAASNQDIVELTSLALRMERVTFDLQTWSRQLRRLWDGADHPSRADLGTSLDKILNPLPDMSVRYESLFEKYRPGIPSGDVRQRHDAIVSAWTKWKARVIEQAEVPDHVTVRFCLNDYYGAQHVRLDMANDDASVPTELFSGVCKPSTIDLSEQPYFVRTFLLPEGDWLPELTITSWGYEGISIAFAELNLSGSRYTPERVTDVSGTIRNPNALLVNDTRTCDIESMPIHDLMQQPERATEQSTLRIHFSKAQNERLSHHR
jgi:hypothetical protein